MGMMMSNTPGFFKFFFRDSSSDQLEIPTSFTTSILKPLPDEVVLKDRYNNVCRVKVEEVGSELHLTKGWQIFVEENSIREGDLIVFDYSSDGLFDTRIYDLSGCETKGLGGKRVKKGRKKTVKEEEEIDASYDHMSDRETDDEETEDDFDRNREQETRSATSEKPIRVKRVLPDMYGAEIFRSGLVRQPSNPYFVTKINPIRKSEFYIPRELISSHNLQLPEEVMFVDAKGRRWSAERQIWKTGRIYYTKGWRNLCVNNSVTEDDMCICEFVQIGEGHCIKVGIVRADRLR